MFYGNNTNNENIKQCSSNNCCDLFWQGKVPLLSEEALHQLHIFIFVLAVAHVFFSATTMLLGGAKVNRPRLSAELLYVALTGCCWLRAVFICYPDTQMETVGGGNSAKQWCRKRYLSGPSWLLLIFMWLELKQRFCSVTTGTDKS